MGRGCPRGRGGRLGLAAVLTPALEGSFRLGLRTRQSVPSLRSIGFGTQWVLLVRLADEGQG